MLGNDRLDRVERILEEMAARQHYHDEALERHDSEMKQIREMLTTASESIRALVRVAELHNRRIEDLEEGREQ